MGELAVYFADRNWLRIIADIYTLPILQRALVSLETSLSAHITSYRLHATIFLDIVAFIHYFEARRKNFDTLAFIYASADL